MVRQSRLDPNDLSACRAINAYLYMIREWADADTNDRIDMALEPPAKYLSLTWDDEEAWASFESAMRSEDG